ncbi:MAG TPA: SRPBCC family protein [Jatrophihabitans sp.]|nr:SRPBCC family protein [Jatrophihabitans sp.]
MRRHLVVRGSAPVQLMWDRYVRPVHWPEWSPQIRRVDYAAQSLRPGTRGVVHGPAGVRVPFAITAVDPMGRSWRWTVQLGPVRVRLAHLVTDGGTELVVEGPAPIVLAYLPVAHLALTRLVRA